jgi:hypothetical protein
VIFTCNEKCYELKTKEKNVTGGKIGVVMALGERGVIRGRRGDDRGCGEDRGGRGGDRVQRSEDGEDNRKENQTMPEAEQHSQQEYLRNNNAKFFQVYDIYQKELHLRTVLLIRIQY